MRQSGTAAGRYVEAFSWHDGVDAFVRDVVTEAPLLHVCSGPVSDFGHVRIDRWVVPVAPGIIADWMMLPFRAGQFAAVFADPPWSAGYMEKCAVFCAEALRVAPVLYLMAPWLWVRADVARSRIWVREFPGIKVPILLVRYERKLRVFL